MGDGDVSEGGHISGERKEASAVASYVLFITSESVIHAYIDKSMRSDAAGYLKPPPRMPCFVRAMLAIVERRLGKPLVANRILAWYPKAFWGSGIMEALVARGEAEVPRRLLKLIRVYVSFLASCPFCIDLNAKEFRDCGISDEEMFALRGLKDFHEVASFSDSERTALEYVRCATSTPVAFTPELIDELRSRFSERAIVVIASTCAQVNFWTRLIQSLGVQPAGFSAECSILDLEKYRTLKGK
jgi:alkylhydroperoxidase family enzyme